MRLEVRLSEIIRQLNIFSYRQSPIYLISKDRSKSLERHIDSIFIQMPEKGYHVANVASGTIATELRMSLKEARYPRALNCDLFLFPSPRKTYLVCLGPGPSASQNKKIPYELP